MEKPPEDQIAILFIIGTVGMLMIVILIILFVIYYQRKMLREKSILQRLEKEHQTQLIRAALNSQELERRRFASDIHDSFTSLLWAIKLHFAYITRSISLPDTLKDPAYEINNGLDEAIDSSRRIAWNLMPVTLEMHGLSSALNELCQRSKSPGISLSFWEEGEKVKINSDSSLLIYRIVQELINNSIKHSGGTKIAIELNWMVDHLIIKVSDNGEGFDFEKELLHLNGVKGLGLLNIKNRLSILHGTIESDTNNNCCHILNIPLVKNEPFKN